MASVSPTYLRLALALVFAALVLLPFAAHAAIVPAELNALADLCNAFVVPNWTCADKANACSNWTGIGCDKAGEHIRQIALMNLGLQGELPYSLGAFTMLERLYFTKNGIYGNIPDNLTGLTNIREMSFANNLLQGPIPASLLRLSTLSKLELSNNRFNGGLSKPINLPSLLHFDAHSNLFTGSLPDFVNSTQLFYLDLGDNRFSGSLPSSYGTLSNLNYMDISNNTLRGDLPASLKDLVKLEHINLEGNTFCGCWPFPANITLIECSANRLSFCCQQNAPSKCSAGQCSNCTSCDVGSLKCALSPAVSPSPTDSIPGSHRTSISRLFVSLSILLLFAAAVGVAFFAWRRQRTRAAIL